MSKDQTIHVDPVAARAQTAIMAASRNYTDVAKIAALEALLSSGKFREDRERDARLYHAKAEALEQAARIIGGIILNDNGLPRS